jgi:hypothetical protein
MINSPAEWVDWGSFDGSKDPVIRRVTPAKETNRAIICVQERATR